MGVAPIGPRYVMQFNAEKCLSCAVRSRCEGGFMASRADEVTEERRAELAEKLTDLANEAIIEIYYLGNKDRKEEFAARLTEALEHEQPDLVGPTGSVILQAFKAQNIEPSKWLAEESEHALMLDRIIDNNREVLDIVEPGLTAQELDDRIASIATFISKGVCPAVVIE